MPPEEGMVIMIDNLGYGIFTFLPAQYVAGLTAAIVAAAPVISVAGKTGVVTLNSTDVGLGSVNNTSDLSKPISTTTQTALNSKMATPAGTNLQYIDGTGALRTFPSIPAAQIQSDWNQANTSALDFIKNKPAAASSPTYQTPAFAGSTGATIATILSSTLNSNVHYAFDATVSISILGGQAVTVILEYADDAGMSSNVVLVDACTTQNSGVLGLSQTNTLRVGGNIPPTKYRKVRFVVTGATAPTAIKAGQEKIG